jgi:tetratricopeptide (TPR) repeat protein
MGSPFISLASLFSSRLLVVAVLLAIDSAQAQVGGAIEWTRNDEGCPAFIRSGRQAIFFRVGETEFVDLNSVALPIGRAGAIEETELSVEERALALPQEGRSIRVTSDRCTATGDIRDLRPMKEEESRAFAQRRARLRTADESLEASARFAEAKRPTEAMQSASQACDIRREVLGATHPLVAACESRQARRAIATRSYEVAFQLALKSADSFALIPPGRRSLEFLESRQVESQALYFLGRPGEAYEAAREATEGRARILGAENENTLGSLGMMAISLQSLGRIDEAIAIQEDLVRLHAKREGQEGPETIRANLNLSASLQQRGEYERVVALQSAVYEARRRTLGEADPATLASAIDLGIALRDAGRIDEALVVVGRALPTILRALGSKDVQALRAKSLLGSVYERLGRTEEALPLFSDVYSARRKTLGDAHPLTASAAYNLANALLKLDRVNEALEIADLGLAMAPPGTNRSLTAEHGLLIAKAEAHLRAGNPKQALETLQSVPAGGDPSGSAPLRHLEATYLRAQATFALGREQEAIDAMNAHYGKCRERFGSEHPLTMEAMGGLARMLAASREAEALTLLGEYVQINERMIREGLVASEGNRGRLNEGVQDRTYSAGYRTYVRLLASRDSVRALEVAELTKARSLSEILMRPQAENPDGRTARVRLALADERLAEADPGSTAYLRAVSDRIKAEDAVRKAIGPNRRNAPIEDITGTLRRVLPRGVVFTEFVVSGDHVTAMTASSQGKVTARNLGPIPGLADTVEAFRRVVTSSSPESERIWSMPNGSIRWSLYRPPGATRLTDLESIGRKLAERLIEPIVPDIGGARSWIIAPDGPLAFLPFELLRIGRQPVIQDRSVTYTPSLASLGIMPARVTTGPRWDFLGVGVTHFPGSSKAWRDLPQAEAEIEALGALFPVSRVLLGTQATEERVRSLDTSGELRRYRYVHFATHAIFSDRASSLSGVVLSGAQVSGTDDIITAAEWPGERSRRALGVRHGPRPSHRGRRSGWIVERLARGRFPRRPPHPLERRRRKRRRIHAPLLQATQSRQISRRSPQGNQTRVRALQRAVLIPEALGAICPLRRPVRK